MAKNESLNNARQAKNDEFYTLYKDIEKELSFYDASQFEDKVIYCNCDNPFKSNFVRYFIDNFNRLKLKKLIATCYDGNVGEGEQEYLFELEMPKPNDNAYKAIITRVDDADRDIGKTLSMAGNSLSILKGNGDFRSRECQGWMKEADIVITNPPFSLFRPLIAMLEKYGKKYLILGNLNAVTYKSIFPLLQSGKMRLGVGEVRDYEIPPYFDKGKVKDGRRYINLAVSGWFTNLEHTDKNKPLELTKHYSPEDYIFYDDIKGIEVSKVEDIPCDYYGIMGVPRWFLTKWNRNEFELVGSGKPFVKGKSVFSRLYIRRRNKKNDKENDNENQD